jgi:Ca-activated chloride channel family protein
VVVQGEVYGGQACVKVTQRYQNTESTPVEAIYTFPLPADATLVGFAMMCNGRRLEGIVKEREEAFHHYDEAIFAGHGAALLEQERANVFTASVGNLLPGEETLVEVQYVQRLQAEEGALRWMIPTLVAPRYIPGTPMGDRTGGGWAEPSDRVPDADRITPPLGPVAYGLTLDLCFDLGSDITVESPSHQVTVSPEAGKRLRVALASPEVGLDRDVVLIARGASDAPLSTVVLHRPADASEPGVLALTVVPDLEGRATATTSQDVVFLLDVSGSMQGAAMGEAETALRLCLRHLRAGDRFNIIAFQSTYALFAPQPVPFTQQTLEQADAWVQTLRATGGTELLAPFLTAVQQAPDGVVVLLTDGQVGNEDEILREVCAARGRARVYSFGIGTNVSDVLLRDLARHTGGAVEFVYPGERIDEKVLVQFARAVAPRITDVTITFSGNDLEVREQAPSTLPALVEGEPWTLFARFTGQGHGQAEIRGQSAGIPFFLTVPIDLSTAVERSLLPRLWAAEWIRELEAIEVHRRRARQMQQRIVDLAVQYGVMSRYTAFLVIEQRTGTRRASGQPATRVIPVHVPAGWAMFERQRQAVLQAHVLRAATASLPSATAPSSPALRAMAPSAFAPVETQFGMARGRRGDVTRAALEVRDQAMPGTSPVHTVDPVTQLLEQQLASGLWDDPNSSDDQEVRRARATARALLTLLQAEVTTHHPVYGAQVRKAVEALVQLAGQLVIHAAHVAEWVLGVAWLVASGQRTRREIEAIIAGHAALSTLRSHLGNAPAVRLYVTERMEIEDGA